MAPDFTHAVLGVSGMNYGGMLLLRSKDWPTYESGLAAAYPDPSGCDRCCSTSSSSCGTAASPTATPGT